jgi:hypothetical protein
MLAASMSAVIGGAVFGTSACSSATPQKTPPAVPENALITLGVQAGPPPVPNMTGISSALKIGGDVYQIDCGLGSMNAFMPPSEVGSPDPATINPNNPAPGLAATSDALLKAFAYTSNIFIRDMGTDDIKDLLKVTEIAVPPGSDYRNRSPKTAPFPVVTDESVAVTATLVSHYDVYPAFGFRFDLAKSTQPRRRLLPQQIPSELPGELAHLGTAGR